jgi:integrase
MAKAVQLPSGNWRVLVYAGKDANGKRIYESFTDIKKNKAELAALEWQEHYKEISRDSSNMTVEEAIDAYIKLKSNLLSPSTIRGYDIIKRNRLKGIINTKLCKLTQNNIQEAINNEAKKLSPKSVYNTYGLLTAILTQYRPGWNIQKIALPQKEKPDGKALSKQEIAILLNGIEGDFIEIPILLALWLGLRRSEVMGLKWSDIDFTNNKITIRRAVVPGKKSRATEKKTKTMKSNRVLNLPLYVADKIKSLPRCNEYLFNMHIDTPTKRFNKICKRLSLGDYSFHDLRRSMATVGVTLNIADKVMMERGGWSNPQTMKNIYQVALENDVDQADRAISAYFESIIKENIQHEMQHEFSNSLDSSCL